MICVVAGGSGMVGAELVTLLLSDPRIEKVIALGRKPLDREDPKLLCVQADFEHAESYAAQLRGATHVFCCLGTTIEVAGSQEAFHKVDCAYPVALARAAHAVECAQFSIITAVGASPTSRIFYSRTKGEAEAAIGALAFPSGVHIFRPSMLLGDRKTSRPAEAVGRAVFSATRGLFRGGLTRYRAIHATELARAMLKAAGDDVPGVHTYEGASLFALTE